MRVAIPSLKLLQIWREEFRGYSMQLFGRDLLAGITVGAVALPLALAFGVASGSTPASGLITAIIAGLVIAAFGGTAFQISGPTGAMSAILVGLSLRYGISGVWAAGLLAGVLLILMGLFRLGRYISFIPSPVITGFTSGIALIIAIGQIDNVLGVKTPAAENSLLKLLGYVRQPPLPDWHALAIAGIVIVVMLVAPRVTKRLPGSLIGIVVATCVSTLLGWNIPVIGAIPSTIILDQRLSLGQIPWSHMQDLLSPAIAIAALGAIETLLCGAVASQMSGKPMDSNQELISQGIGNILLPFFGGVPATAAIARTSVGVKSGGVTRMVSFVHAGLLLLSVFALGRVIGLVPLSALGGVLFVTAWRMNEWESIRFFASRRLKHALAGMLVTMVATVALDLTQAILIGIALSAVIYLRQSASAFSVIDEPVNVEKVRGNGYALASACEDVHVYYITGPLFFGSVNSITQLADGGTHYGTLVISARGMPMVDVMGIHALEHLIRAQRARGGTVLFASIQPAVQRMMERTGLLAQIGAENIYWSAAEAIVAAHQQHMSSGCAHCQPAPALPLPAGASPA